MGMQGDRSLICGYPFENSGADVMGRYPATLYGATYDVGRISKGVKFDGVDDNVKLGNITETNGVQKLSVFLSAIMTIQDTRIAAFIMKEVLGDTSSSNRWALCPSQPTIGDSNDILCLIGNGSNSYGYTTNNILPLNQWFRIGFVYDGTKSTNATRLKVYFNCVQQTLTFSGTIPSSLGTNAAEVIMGYYNRYEYFKGSISEPKIYYDAILQPQIQRDYLNLPIL